MFNNTKLAMYVADDVSMCFITCIGKEKPNIKDISDHVVTKWASKWASKWRELGTQLNIDQHLMDIIECDIPNDCRKCCLRMFHEWLGVRPVASWEDIIIAVDNLQSLGMLINHN